jgi:hypothetical protein
MVGSRETEERIRSWISFRFEKLALSTSWSFAFGGELYLGLGAIKLLKYVVWFGRLAVCLW